MSENKHHIIPLSTYIAVFISLIIMTIITVISSQYDFGSLNIIIALFIATFKSSLVLLFFMHLYYDNKINMALIIGSLLFLAIFIGLTMIDVTRRQDIYDIKGKLVNPHAPIYDQNTSKDGH